MTKFPCPSCGKQRASTEAQCEGCGWSPLPPSEPVNDPQPDRTHYVNAMQLVRPFGGMLGLLLSLVLRPHFDFAQGWFSTIVFVGVGAIVGGVVIAVVVKLVTRFLAGENNDSDLDDIHPKYFDR
jgi:hypothetical protein